MDYTFKRQTKHKALPFLEKYKDKITRVNRFSGLKGALDQINVPKSTKSVSEKCLTEVNESKMNVKKDFRRMKTSNVSQSRARVEVTVNKFITPEVEGEDPGKENIDINAKNDLRKTLDRIRQWKMCLDENKPDSKSCQIGHQQSFLPKIGVTQKLDDPTQHDNRIQKRMKVNPRYTMMRLQKKSCLPKLDLR